MAETEIVKLHNFCNSAQGDMCRMLSLFDVALGPSALDLDRIR